MMSGLQTQDLPQSMKQIEALFNQSLPTSAFDYVFLDDHLDTLYRREQRTASVVMVFSCLAILIACLGLFGLAAFTAEQHTKEIGVRKVLGASIGSIVQLLSRDFLRFRSKVVEGFAIEVKAIFEEEQNLAELHRVLEK